MCPDQVDWNTHFFNQFDRIASKKLRMDLPKHSVERMSPKDSIRTFEPPPLKEKTTAFPPLLHKEIGKKICDQWNYPDQARSGRIFLASNRGKRFS